MSEMIIYPLFAMDSMMRITEVEISKKSKCAKQTAIPKSLKSLYFLYTLSAPCQK